MATVLTRKQEDFIERLTKHVWQLGNLAGIGSTAAYCGARPQVLEPSLSKTMATAQSSSGCSDLRSLPQSRKGRHAVRMDERNPGNDSR